MPTTPSASVLDLAFHTHLRTGVLIETIGDLRALLTCADLPDDLPVETLLSGRLLARYWPELAPLPSAPCSGYHAHLDLSGADDADAEDAWRLADLLDQARAYADAVATPALERAV
jgi:hypothetical protein